MKKSPGTPLLLAAAFLFLLLHFSCKKENSLDCIKRTGKSVTETRALPPFNKIRMRDNVDVFIKEGAEYSIKIEAGNNLIDLIKTEVDSGILEIDNKNLCNWSRSYKRGTINAWVTLPSLRHLWNYGSSLALAEDTLHCDTLEVWAHQSGDVDLTVNTNIVYINMHTTANLTLKGQTGYISGWHVGEGIFYGSDLSATDGFIQTRSSGDNYMNVQNNLVAVIDWEGNVFYKGNPSTTLIGSGTGKLIKQD